MRMYRECVGLACSVNLLAFVLLWLDLSKIEFVAMFDDGWMIFIRTIMIEMGVLGEMMKCSVASFPRENTSFCVSCFEMHVLLSMEDEFPHC